MSSKIQCAKLAWQADVPVSELFSDPYFSLENGEAETEYVFLQHNNLPAAFLSDACAESQSFCIGETGFGTGLNFFVTAKSWVSTFSSSKKNPETLPHLYYYSVEKYPIEKHQLAKILKKWPQFNSFYHSFLSQYPGNIPGFHSIQFPSHNLTLVLMIGDVSDMLDQMLTPMDAWYLDGFSPSKNPDMWSQKVFEKIAKVSKPKATFATFAAAGFVRRNLKSAGFFVKKAPGFGKKREMLQGNVSQLSGDRLSGNSKWNKSALPWYALSHVAERKTTLPVVIIGGGVAGLSSAFELAKKNINSLMLEAGKALGTGASGNPAGIVLPRITADLNAESQFYVNSFHYALKQYDDLKVKFSDLCWKKTGVLQLDSQPLLSLRIKKIAKLSLPASLLKVVDAEEASVMAGIKVSTSALYFPQAGVINPQQLCEILRETSAEHLKIQYKTFVHSLRQDDEVWVLIDSSGEEICRAENIIIANSFDASRLLKTEIYNVSPNRGQLSFIPSNDKSKDLKASICGDGYVIPSSKLFGSPLQGSEWESAELQSHVHVVGATYGGHSDAINQADHDLNRETIDALMPSCFEASVQPSGGRVSFRATTADHLPVVGPVIDENFYQHHYANLHYGKAAKTYPDAIYKKGLYLTIGHGSRGLVSCMVSSKYIVDLISGSAMTTSVDMVSLLHPGRFLIRQFKKMALQKNLNETEI